MRTEGPVLRSIGRECSGSELPVASADGSHAYAVALEQMQGPTEAARALQPRQRGPIEPAQGLPVIDGRYPLEPRF